MSNKEYDQRGFHLMVFNTGDISHSVAYLFYKCSDFSFWSGRVQVFYDGTLRFIWLKLICVELPINIFH
jgi:hypothetical protein